MSEQRRRRRRKRRGRRGASTAAAPAQAEQAAPPPAAGAQGDAGAAADTPAPGAATAGARRRRRRRRGGDKRVAEAASPKSSEDIFRAARPQRGSVGAPHDGRTLEGVIGDLQSIWGVPQSPQEFRITLKVAEERVVRGERVAAIDEVKEDPPADGNGAPRREKAPAAPRIAPATAGEEPAVPTARRKRPRRRRRRR